MDVKNLKPEEFKRLCGVHPETFSQMTEVVRSLYRWLAFSDYSSKQEREIVTLGKNQSRGVALV